MFFYSCAHSPIQYFCEALLSFCRWGWGGRESSWARTVQAKQPGILVWKPGPFKQEFAFRVSNFERHWLLCKAIPLSSACVKLVQQHPGGTRHWELWLLLCRARREKAPVAPAGLWMSMGKGDGLWVKPGLHPVSLLHCNPTGASRGIHCRARCQLWLGCQCVFQQRGNELGCENLSREGGSGKETENF